MPYGIVYELLCLTTRLRYIGQTVQSLNARWRGHVRAADHDVDWELPKAIREHGTSNFEKRVICECQSRSELNEAEKHWINALNTVWPNGYNLRNSGQYTSDETRLKMRLAKLGKKQSDEHKRKISEALQGRIGTWAGRTQNEESNQKRSVALAGKKKSPFTEKHRRNIAEAKLGTVPWNKLSSTADHERIAAINEATLDRLHTHIVQLVKNGLSFAEIVERSGKKYRTVRSAILRALKKEQIEALPAGFYKHGPYRKNNK
jgi:group I intron endonuclease